MGNSDMIPEGIDGKTLTPATPENLRPLIGRKVTLLFGDCVVRRTIKLDTSHIDSCTGRPMERWFAMATKKGVQLSRHDLIVG